MGLGRAGRNHGRVERFARVLLVSLTVPAAFAAFATAATAQQKPAAGPGRAAAPKKAAAVDAGTPQAHTPAPAPVQVVPSSGSGSGDAGLVEARTLDGGARVFKFKELDIEGRLKSPQLVYFLRRVRAEFAAEDLGHRTFLREMSETRKEPSF
jgi:hypothetical protein